MKTLILTCAAVMLVGCATTTKSTSATDTSVRLAESGMIAGKGFAVQPDGSEFHTGMGLRCETSLMGMAFDKAVEFGGRSDDIGCLYSGADDDSLTLYFGAFPELHGDDYAKDSIQATAMAVQEAGFEYDEDASKICRDAMMDSPARMSADMMRGVTDLLAGNAGTTIEVGPPDLAIFSRGGVLQFIAADEILKNEHIKIRYTGSAKPKTLCKLVSTIMLDLETGIRDTRGLGTLDINSLE